MNSLSIIIGSIIIVISLIIAIVGGWEKFHLERKNDAWLAMFIVGMIGIIAGVVLVLIGIYTNRPKKIGLDDTSLRAIYDYNKSLPRSVPITQQAVRRNGTIGLTGNRVPFAPVVPTVPTVPTSATATGAATSTIAAAGAATSTIAAAGAATSAVAPTATGAATTSAIAAAGETTGVSKSGIIAAASKYSKVDITNVYEYIGKRTPTEISLLQDRVCPITYKPLKSVKYSEQTMGGLFD